MKKLIISLMLVIFVFGAFYPVIYATEEMISNNSIQTNEVEQEESKIEEEEEIEETENKISEEVLQENSVSENKVDEVKTQPQEETFLNSVSENQVEENVVEIIAPMKKSEMPENQVVTIQESTRTQQLPAGQVYIDTPTNQQNYIIGEDKIKITGWAVANEKDVSLKVYVNNWLWAEIYERTERKDVNRMAEKYGGVTTKAGFTKELDTSVWETGNYTLRIDQVSKNGELIGSDSRTIKVAKKQSAGQVYIDTPTNQQNYIIGEDKIKITGWAVANEKDVVLKVYVNNWLWAEIYERTERKDVNRMAEKYGGVTTKAGFTKELDTSVWETGNYTLRIDQVTSKGDVIGSDSRAIKVAKKQSAGQVFMDTPTNNQSYAFPNTSKIQVSGWAVANEKDVVLKVYVNNWLWAEIYERTERKDVNRMAEKYGGVTTKAGFSKELDISVWETGNYTIRIDQVARNGQLIGSDSRNVKVTKKEYEGRMYIDSPSSNGTYKLPDVSKIKIDGWAVSNDENAYILASIDGKTCSYTVDRKVRADIDKNISPAYGGSAITPKAGFSVNIDISNLFEGNHIIEVLEVSRYDKIITRSQILINISTPDYAGNMNLEEPIQNKRYRSGWLEVKGWAITESKNDFLEIYLDGNYITRPERRKRADVVNAFQGQYGVNANSTPGFYSQINTSHLGEGMHTLKVVHYSGYGKKIQEREVRFVISNTMTWGIDVSYHQKAINWNAVKNQGVNFAIIRVGYYSESSKTFHLDTRFNEYYNECKRLGIALGGYIYSYEFNPEEAKHEAEACLQHIRGKSFELPIFLDIEDEKIKNAILNGTTNVNNVTNGAITFCNMMNQNGYQAGVYANKDFFTHYLNASVLEQYNIWLAHYTNAPSSDYPGRYDIWQYTSAGSIPGIDGPVDLNWCFKRYY